MHGVRVALLEQPAAATGLPRERVFVSERGSNEEYQPKMSDSLRAHQARGVTAGAFAGPVCQQPVRFTLGEKVYRLVGPTPPTEANSSPVCPSGPRQTKGFWFCDLRPVENGDQAGRS